jgi:ATP-dependent DNA ligase
LNGLFCRIATGRAPESKTNRTLPNPELKSVLAELMRIAEEHGVILEGELYSHTAQFHDISGSIMSRSRKLPSGLKFHAFGCRPASGGAWRFGWQIEFLRNHVAGLSCADVIEQHTVARASDVRTFFGAVTSRGGEGVVIRGEAEGIDKRKPVETFDGRIVGYREGRGRLADTLGAIIVQLDGGQSLLFADAGETIRVGGGLTDALRSEIWRNRSSYLGRWVEFAGTTVGAQSKPLQPRFVCFRAADECGQKV